MRLKKDDELQAIIDNGKKDVDEVMNMLTERGDGECAQELLDQLDAEIAKENSSSNTEDKKNSPFLQLLLLCKSRMIVMIV